MSRLISSCAAFLACYSKRIVTVVTIGGIADSIVIHGCWFALEWPQETVRDTKRLTSRRYKTTVISTSLYILDAIDQDIDSRLAIIFGGSVKDRNSQDDFRGVQSLDLELAVVLSLA